jgi:hypothetical protein
VDEFAAQLVGLIDADPRPAVEDILRPTRAMRAARETGTHFSVTLIGHVLRLAADQRFTAAERLQLYGATRSIWEDDATLARLAETRIGQLKTRIREDDDREATQRQSKGLALALRQFEAELAAITSISVLRRLARDHFEAADHRRHVLVLARMRDLEPTPGSRRALAAGYVEAGAGARERKATARWRCDGCGGLIGVYEPVIAVLADGGARETSWLDTGLSADYAATYHRGCRADEQRS